MKLEDVRQRAADLGICADDRKKGELILAIQLAEGNQACFGQNDGQCPHRDCCWWQDCRQAWRQQSKA